MTYYTRKEQVTKYYKWGSPNVIISGSPTINNGVISNLTDSNNCKIDHAYVSNNATYVFKFTTADVIDDVDEIVHKEYFLNIGTRTGNKITFYNWSNKKTYEWFTANLNTTYWVKIIVNGNNKTYSYSTDGTTFTGSQTITDTGMKLSDYTYSFVLGASSHSSNHSFNGTIDLKGCYIEQNGKKVWTGMTIVKGTSSDYVFTKNENAYYTRKDGNLYYAREN